jgi:hypothetical protein
MKHLGLFEGIGGFSLAAKWMGWETVAYQLYRVIEIIDAEIRNGQPNMEADVWRGGKI